jgi:hypothetical protein
MGMTARFDWPAAWRGGFRTPDEKAHISISDAARRFLVPGGAVIPNRLDLFLGLGTSVQAKSFGRAWEQAGRNYGLPYERFDSLLSGIGFAARCEDLVTGIPTRAVPAWTPWQSVDLVRNDFEGHTVVPMRAVREGPVDGVAIAWRAHLTDDIILSTLPDAPETHWKQAFFHLDNPIAGQVDDLFVFEIAFSEVPYRPLVCQWKLHHSRSADSARFIASLPTLIRPFVETGQVGVIRPTTTG